LAIEVVKLLVKLLMKLYQRQPMSCLDAAEERESERLLLGRPTTYVIDPRLDSAVPAIWPQPGAPPLDNPPFHTACLHTHTHTRS
jgi:hypothetical protein